MRGIRVAPPLTRSGCDLRSANDVTNGRDYQDLLGNREGGEKSLRRLHFSTPDKVSRRAEQYNPETDDGSSGLRNDCI